MLDDCIRQKEVTGPGAYHVERVHTKHPESLIAAGLTHIADSFRDRGVKIGSYPKAGFVLITLEGPDKETVQVRSRAVRRAGVVVNASALPPPLFELRLTQA
jgi:hypothetical protein